MKGKKNNQSGKVEEVEFSHELADSADWDAIARMKEANKRAKIKTEKE